MSVAISVDGEAGSGAIGGGACGPPARKAAFRARPEHRLKPAGAGVTDGLNRTLLLPGHCQTPQRKLHSEGEFAILDTGHSK